MIPAVMIRAIQLDLRTPAQTLQVAKDAENPISGATLLVMLLEAGTLDAAQMTEACALVLKQIVPQLDDNKFPAKHLLPRLFPLLEGTQFDAVFDLMLEHGLDFGAPLDVIASTLQDKHWARLVTYAQERPEGRDAWHRPTGLVYRMMEGVPEKYVPALIDDVLAREGLAHVVAGNIKRVASRTNPKQAMRLLEKAMAMEPDAYFSAYRGETLAALVPVLPPEGVARVIDDVRTGAVGQPYVPPLVFSKAVQHDLVYMDDAVTHICQLEKYWKVNEILGNLVPYLQWTDYLPTLVTCAEMAPAQDYHHTIYPLLPLVDDAERDRLVKKGLDMLLNVQAGDPDSISDEYRVGSFRRMAPHLTKNTLDAALHMAAQIKSHRERCYMYTDMLNVAPDARRREVMRLALDVADSSTHAPHIMGRNEGLQRLAPHLEGNLLEEAFAMAMHPAIPDYIQQMEDDMGRSFKASYYAGGDAVLAAMAPQMTPDMVRTVLERDGI